MFGSLRNRLLKLGTEISFKLCKELIKPLLQLRVDKPFVLELLFGNFRLDLVAEAGSFFGKI